MKGRSILTIEDLAEAEVMHLLQLATQLKAKKKAGVRGDLLTGKHIALVFEKASTRTRCAATVAALDEGGTAEYLDARDIHLGKKESVADTARVLGRMFDGIMFRGYRQKTVVELAKHAGVPVWNGLTDDWHPTQALADLMTIQEHFGGLDDLKVVYVGNGKNNVSNSLMLGCAGLGVGFVSCNPEELSPQTDLVEAASKMAAKKGTLVEISHDPKEAVKGANVIYTDVWVSMGEESKLAERLELLRPYQVDMAMMHATGNVGNGRLIFLHCLPAFHGVGTDSISEHGEMEVTDDVFESEMSKVFDLAENRMHTIRALMVATVA